MKSGTKSFKSGKKRLLGRQPKDSKATKKRLQCRQDKPKGRAGTKRLQGRERDS